MGYFKPSQKAEQWLMWRIFLAVLLQSDGDRPWRCLTLGFFVQAYFP